MVMVIRLLKTIILCAGLQMGPVSAAASLDFAAINKIGADVFKDNTAVKSLTKQLQQLQNKVTEDEKYIASQSEVLANVIHYLRHFRYYSSSMVVLSAPKPEDIVHLQILLESIIPKMQLQHKGVREHLKKIQTAYQEIDRYHRQTKKLENRIQGKISDLIALITVENIDKRQSIVPLTSIEFSQLEGAIQPFLNEAKQAENNTSPQLTLMSPINGVVSQADEQSVFTTGNVNQIVFAPMDGTILLTAHVPGQNVFMFLGQGIDQLSIIGLDFIVVNKGQRVRRGDVLGVITSGDNKDKRLILKYYHQGQYVNKDLWEEGL